MKSFLFTKRNRKFLPFQLKNRRERWWWPIGLVAVYCLLPFFLSRAKSAPAAPLSNRIANYRIQAKLDIEQKSVQATEWIEWKNLSPDTVPDLYFHLYQNAFRNKNSTFLSVASSRHRRTSRFDPKHPGGTDILLLQINDGEDLTQAIEFVQPDDDNRKDSTVIRVPLPEPVLPGETIQLKIEFVTRLPKMVARSGFVRDFFMISQWFPKLGVWENGKWNCHQYHVNSEFFADFGTYDVEFTLPTEYVVAATGSLVRQEITDSLTRHHFMAEDVHDFVLTAWPGYLRASREIGGVEVTLLYDPNHAEYVDRYFSVIESGLSQMGEWLMPYPYPGLTLVDPPFFAFRAAGMEYPQLILCGSLRWLSDRTRLFPEEVTLHEFAHQYFYGILASNEFEEPWLDEGFTSYATQKMLTRIGGIHTSLMRLMGLTMGELDVQRLSYLRRAKKDSILNASWEYKQGAYGVMAYSKPAIMLQTLENYLGAETMNRIMKTYIQRWRFRHPKTADFLNIVDEVNGQDMGWFFDQALRDIAFLDNALITIISENPQIDSTGRKIVRSRVKVFRRGEFIMPVEVQIEFSDGRTELLHWNGKEIETVFTIEDSLPVVAATVDPQRKIWLDANISNNSFSVNAAASIWRKVLGFFLVGGSLF